VDDHAGRLVDDEQVLVLVCNPQVARLRLQNRLHPLARVDLDELPAHQPVALRPGLAVNPNGPARDQTFGLGTRGDVRQRGDEPVEPLAGSNGRNPKREGQWRLSPSRIAAKRMPTPTTMNVSARLKAGQ
jgi:hypothetical protein